MSMTQKLRRFTSLLLASVLLSTVLIGTVTPKQAEAATLTTAESTAVNGKILDHQMYYFLVSCFANVNMDTVTLDEVYNYEWFKNTDTTSVRGSMYDNEHADCDNGDYIKEGLERFGLAGSDAKVLDTFCSLDFTYNKENKDGDDAHDKQNCIDNATLDDFDGADGSNAQSTQRAAIIKLLDSTPKGPTAKGALTPAEEYIRKYRTLVNGCHITLQRVITPAELNGGDNPANGQDKLFDIPTVLADGSIIHVLGASGKSGGVQFDDGTKVYLVANTKTDSFLSGRSTQITCGQLAKDLRADSDKLPKAYAAYLKSAEGQDDEVNNGDDAAGAADKTCESESGPLGWILCPVLTMIDGAINLLDGAINELLFIEQKVYAGDNISSSWAVIRNIALFILVPMMMFMVIGTAIGFGPFDAYTVKKALPRMLIAVIFIVLSLPITQFGVELSNAVGQGAGNLIISAVPEDQRIESLKDIFAKNDSQGGDSLFTGLTIAGAVGAGLAGVLTIGIIMSFALVTIVALLLGFVILVMRQVLILLLIVIAPLAILVWIFPGNDKLWAIWKTTFIAMLLLYPIISILIASGKFVAGIAG